MPLKSEPPCLNTLPYIVGVDMASLLALHKFPGKFGTLHHLVLCLASFQPTLSLISKDNWSIASFIIYFENIEFWAREQGDMSSSLSYTYNARTSNKPVDEWMDMLAIKHYSKTSCFKSCDEIGIQIEFYYNFILSNISLTE